MISNGEKGEFHEPTASEVIQALTLICGGAKNPRAQKLLKLLSIYHMDNIQFDLTYTETIAFADCIPDEILLASDTVKRAGQVELNLTFSVVPPDKSGKKVFTMTSDGEPLDGSQTS